MSAINLPSPLDQLDAADRTSIMLNVGETLFLQGSATAGLYYLVSGVIEMSRVTETGHTVLIHHARAGETIAEASLFSDVYHCTATVSRDARLIECKRAVMLDWLAKDGQFASTLAARFAAQIQESRRRIEILSIRAADERILMALHDGLLVDDIAGFAETIALAPETVYRLLSQLSEKGLVEKTARGRYRTALSDQ